MTPQELTDTFIAAGYDTPAKVSELLKSAGLFVSRESINAAIEQAGIDAAAANSAAVVATEQKMNTLRAQLADVKARIGATVAK